MLVEPWLLLGLLTAIAIGGINAYQKHLMNGDESPITVSFQSNLTAVPLTLGLLAVVGLQLPPLPGLGLAALSGVANAGALYLFAVALDRADLSLVAPFQGLSPIVLALVEPLVLMQASYSAVTAVASVLAGIGGYVLMSDKSLTKPLKRITNTAPLLTLVGVCLIATAMLIDRYAVNAFIAPTRYPVYLVGFTTIGMFIVSLSSITGEVSYRPTKAFVPLGAFRFMTILPGMIAFTMTTSTNVSILSQLGSVVAVVIGILAFGEEHPTTRLIGAVMLASAAAILALG